ncbi:protein FAM174C [Xenopus laevis]|uniref:Protein FAM174C n=2 Tax=Xenopus laevis TaxID=8355 RepID=A0A1L8HX54_XENLA|nr:protein FAM174C [Xenopus laevis]OCU00458.1 hypothetical protein XELAEV_18006235mg [Xenopus laevis]
MWFIASIFIFLVVGRLVDSFGSNSTTPSHIADFTTKYNSQNTTAKLNVQENFFGANMQMVQRAFYVLIGISLLAVLYFIIRTVRLKKKPLRKKYGLLSDYDENMEMGSLDSDEEKIFEARSLRR